MELLVGAGDGEERKWEPQMVGVANGGSRKEKKIIVRAFLLNGFR